MKTLKEETERMLRWAKGESDPIAALEERLASDIWSVEHSPWRRDRLFIRDSEHEIAGIRAALEILRDPIVPPIKTMQGPEEE